MQRLITTAGHVDHGKSTLVRALTGHDPDRWEEERTRGLTIDLGFEWTTRTRLRDGLVGAAALDVPRHWDNLDDLVFFVDVPGHHRFIDNLLTAMVDARFVLLVVSGVEGWSQGTQVHVDILDALGVADGVVAISRADDPAALPFELLAPEVEEWLEPTSLAGSSILAVDSVTGTGLPELVDALLAGLDRVAPARAGRARLWVDRSFSIRGAGTVVTGQLEGSAVQAGDPVKLAPGGEDSSIRALHVGGQPVERAEPGVRLAVNLRGLSPADVTRGSALVGRAEGEQRGGAPALVTASDIGARITVTAPAGLRSRGAWTVHVGTAKTSARVTLVGASSAAPGETVHARVRLSTPLPLLVGDRFLLWDSGRAAVGGGGVVLDTEPRGRRRRLPANDRSRLLGAIDPVDDPHALASELLEADGGFRSWTELAWLLDLPAGSGVGVQRVGTWAVSDAMWARVRDASLTAVEQRPRSSREVVTTAIRADIPGLPTDLVHRALEQLVVDGVLGRVGTEFVTPSDVEAVVADRADRVAALVEAVRAGGLEPEALTQLRRETGTSATEVARLMASGDLVVSEDFGFAPEHFDAAIDALRGAFGGEWFATTDARQLWDVTRKYALAILDAADRMKVTEFATDGRRRLLDAASRR